MVRPAWAIAKEWCEPVFASLQWALTRRTTSRRQLRRREGVWEGSRRQNSDSMDKNHVKRQGMPGKLAIDSNAPRGSKQSPVDVARIEGKLSTKLVSPLSGEVFLKREKSAEAIIVGGEKNSDEGPNGKELSRKE